MSSHMAYGAIPHQQGAPEGSRRRGLLVGSRTGRAALAAAATASPSRQHKVLAAGTLCCLLGLAGVFRTQGAEPSVLYYHGLGDPVTWDGVGAGGTGPAYSWTVHSFSPIGRRQVNIQFTHDHSSYANYHNGTGNGTNGTWVVGAAQEFPVIASRPYGWLDREIEVPCLNGANCSNATANATNGTEGGEARLSAYDYFARLFPIEKGYSYYLFSGKQEPDKNASAANATAEEVENAEEEAEGEAEEMKRLRGVDSPMVFNDLPQAPGLGGAPIQKPIFTHNPVQFDFRRR